ncbi:MFS transporter [Pseudomonas sp. MDT1-16]
MKVNASIFDGHLIRVWQYLILMSVVLILVIDGLDVQLLAFVTPVILGEWGVERAAFAPALAAVMVGMALGAAFGGMLGDRIGRRPVLIGATLSFGLATALVSQVQDISALTVLRFFSGLGFGAATPNAFALATEWLPNRARSLAVGIVAVAAPLGGMIGAGATVVLLPEFGWRGTFIICGLSTALFGIILYMLLPESPTFLMAKGRHQKAVAVLRRVNISLPEAHQASVQISFEKVHRTTMFRNELLRLNIGAALAFFTFNFATFAILSWMPTILSDNNFPIKDALRSAFIFNMMAVVGTLSSSASINRLGSKFVMRASCCATLGGTAGLLAILIAGSAQSGGTHWYILFTCIGFAGFGLGGGMTSTYAIVSTGYPVECRATGIGFCVMAGRIGAVVTILAGGILLSDKGGAPIKFLAAIFLVMLIGLVATFIIDRHAPRRTG